MCSVILRNGLPEKKKKKRRRKKGKMLWCLTNHMCDHGRGINPFASTLQGCSIPPTKQRTKKVIPSPKWAAPNQHAVLETLALKLPGWPSKSSGKISAFLLTSICDSGPLAHDRNGLVLPEKRRGSRNQWAPRPLDSL